MMDTLDAPRHPLLDRARESGLLAVCAHLDDDVAAGLDVGPRLRQVPAALLLEHRRDIGRGTGTQALVPGSIARVKSSKGVGSTTERSSLFWGSASRSSSATMPGFGPMYSFHLPTRTAE